MIKSNQIARGVRVKLNENFKDKCLGDSYLRDEKILFIDESKPYNDSIGEYVFIKGGSLINSGYAYLDQLDLVNPVPEMPLYNFKEEYGKDVEETHIEHAINPDFDFWIDANEFLKSIINENTEDFIRKHIESRGFNKNEVRLFRASLTQAFDILPMMAQLKNEL